MGNSQQFNEVRNAFVSMKPGEEKDIKGQQVRRISSQKWEVNGKVCTCRVDAQHAVLAQVRR